MSRRSSDLARKVFFIIAYDGPQKLDGDKCEQFESSRTDSGFLSGGNLVVSGEIVSEDEKVQPVGPHMHLDSGVDLGLSESFSNLSLKHPELNDLGSKGHKSEKFALKERQSWEVYYQQDEDGDTQLHMAIINDIPQVALALIRQTPHPRLLDTRNDVGMTPLHLAVAMGRPRVARALIVAGAEPGPRNAHGDSPMHIAARAGDLACCRAVGDPVSQTERQELALAYLPQSYRTYNLNQWNYVGETCVHVAAINGHVEVLRYLVCHGADVNAREGCGGLSALHMAVARADERLIRFLLTECAPQLDLEVVTYGGRGALQMGQQLSPDLADELVARGVPSPYSSDEEDSDDEMYENSNIFIPNLVNASA